MSEPLRPAAARSASSTEILAPISGDIVNLEDVPGVALAENVIGDGIAIKPSGSKLVAPCDGTIVKIFSENSAFAIESNDGIKISVQFGVDTVELKGEGFTKVAEEGQKVKKGDTVLEVDLALLEEKAQSTLTPVVISNAVEAAALTGSVVAGNTPVMRVKKA